MSPTDKPRKRVNNPPQKLQKTSHKWMYIALVLIVVVIAVGAVALLRNPLSPSQNNNTPKVNPIAVIDTTMGTIKVELYTDKMPITTANFIKLANNGFYSGLVFHRVMDNFMIQGGGFYPNGTQKQDPYGTIKLETSPDVLHVDGAISMARLSTPVDSATSQFFICDGAQTGLDGQYAAFGEVIDGMDVVRAIASVTTTTKYTSYQNWPVDDVIINSITIETT
ncbi:MAG: peptidylprolyl isomerase [Euryarchaeota archaeon]|nr:peptidylprolyl isomerase [Euryarchaeota archaeon]